MEKNWEQKTVARINNPEFINCTTIDLKELGLDYVISPEELAAKEIKMLLDQSTFNDSITFEEGILNIVGSTLEKVLRSLTFLYNKQKINFQKLNLSP